MPETRGPDTIPLARGTIHLFLGDLDAPPASLHRLESLLSAEERARIARLRFEALRHRQIAAAGMLRLVLSWFSGSPPGKLDIRRAEGGKPFLSEGPSFNLSHSDGHLLIGVAREGRVGVDIECVRAMNDQLRLADRTFAPEEARALRNLPPAHQTSAFFRIWTRKEALAKAVGRGLYLPLSSFSVVHDEPLLGSEPSNVLLSIGPDFPPDDSPSAPWWVQPLDRSRLPSDAQAAVAWDRGKPTLEFETLTPPS